MGHGTEEEQSEEAAFSLDSRMDLIERESPIVLSTFSKVHSFPFASLIVCLLAVPLNFVVAALVVCERYTNSDSHFRSSFFDIILVQMFMDPPALAMFFIFYVLKAEPPFNTAFYQLNDTAFPAFCYYSLYFALYWKIIGVVLITVQRHSSIVHPHSSFTRLFDRHPLRIALSSMAIGPLIVGALWAAGPKIHFSDPHDLKFKARRDIISRNVNLTFALITSTIVMSVIAYGRIGNRIYTIFKAAGRRANRSQIRMTLQGLPQLVALVFIDVYFAIVSLAHLPTSEDVETMRRWYHIFYFLLSILNPAMLVILNPHTRSRLFCMHRFGRARSQQSIVYVVSTSSRDTASPKTNKGPFAKHNKVGTFRRGDSCSSTSL